ncbi:MAG: hypothetical protein R3330_01615 [Saprospiraceae bacterium]|nr:hypothetical protein [Saprospiraceae bacterium]
MIRVIFECSGCHEAAEPVMLQSERVPLGGSFYTYREPSMQDIAPEGWVAFDPYTQCTYCPACWESIESPVEVVVIQLVPEGSGKGG